MAQFSSIVKKMFVIISQDNQKKSVMEVYEGSVLTIENNKIELNGKKVSADGDLNKQKGLVHLHVSY